LAYFAESDGDTCGRRSYQITSSPISTPNTSQLTSSELRINTGSIITLSPTAHTSIGTHTAILTAKLADYPSVTLSVSFTITVEPCVVQRL